MDIELLSTIVMVVVPLLLLVEGIVVLLVWAHLDGGMPWLVSGWRTPGREGVRGDSVGYWLIATTATALAGWIVSFISVHALGFINCAPGFADLPMVMNGFSDLMVAVFGDLGRSTRSASRASSMARSTS